MDSLEVTSQEKTYRNDGQLSFSFNCDSEFLSHETFDLDHSFKGMNPFDLSDTQQVPEVITEGTAIAPQEIEMEQEDELPLDGPGVLFSLQKGKNTFCLRGFACGDGAHEFSELVKDKERFEKIFRTDDLEEVKFFATPSVECAQVVWEQFGNRRLPYFEEVVCNISDPGFSWWFEEVEGGFNVYFKSHGVERKEQFLCLGPIGDPRITNYRLRKIKETLLSRYTLENFTCNETVFRCVADEDNARLVSSFGRLFLEGDLDFHSEDFATLDISHKCFIEELAFSRRFWLEVEDLLEEELSIN